MSCLSFLTLWSLGARHKKNPNNHAGMKRLADPTQTLAFIQEVIVEHLTLCFLICKVGIIAIGWAWQDKALGTWPSQRYL